MWVDLTPVTADVEPGSETAVEVTVRNTGDIVEEYHLQVTGDPGRWCLVEPQALRLYPGTTGTAQLTFAPPRSSDAQAGPQPYAVKVTPRESRENTFAIEGVLRVEEFADMRAELLPPTTRGWHRGRVRLAVDNYSNTATSAAVAATSTASDVQVDIRTPALQIQPGRAHFSKFSVRPGRLLWFGTKVKHPYTITVTPSGLGQPVTIQGSYLQSALLPRWLQRLVMFAGALTAAGLALWFGIHPSFASSAQSAPQPAAATNPTVNVAPPSIAPPPSPSQHPTSAESTKPATAPTKAPPPPAAQTSTKPAPPPPPSLMQTNNILNYAANASIDLNMDKFNNGQQVDLWDTNHSRAQAWTVWSYSDGTVVIQSDDQTTGAKVIQTKQNDPGTVELWDTDGGLNGLNHKQANDTQQWIMSTIPNGAPFVTLKNKKTGTCLAGKGDKQWLTTAQCNNGDPNQWWNLNAG